MTEATVKARASNRKAGNERERLFSALEAFVNLGDGRRAWKLFRKQSPTFLPDFAYAGAVRWSTDESPESKKPSLYALRDGLRRVWRGIDPGGAFLNALLGVSYDDAALYKDWDESTEGGITLGMSHPHADWQTREITFDFKYEFQWALFALMKDAWRAKVCPECSRFFIATKTAQAYCSSACYGDMKRKSSLDYWRRVGSAKREKRNKQSKQKRGEI